METSKREKKSLESKVRGISDEIERHREEAKKKGLCFTAPTREQIYRKLTKKGSPMITYQVWGPPVAPGGTFPYKVGIHNPDPVGQIWLFCHVFVGSANLASDVGEALCAVDTRFPRLTLPKFSGLSIDAGATKELSFSIKVPAGVDRSNYMGNSFVFRATWHDVGEYLDRGLFIFEVI